MTRARVRNVYGDSKPNNEIVCTVFQSFAIVAAEFKLTKRKSSSHVKTDQKTRNNNVKPRRDRGNVRYTI